MPRRLFAYAPAFLVLLALTAQAAPQPSLPASEDTAKERLEHSPRHGEFVTVDAGGSPVRVWVVYPERKDKAPVVVVIHEIFGLTDWIRAVADQLAAAVVYYGTPPQDLSTLSAVRAPVLGLYGGDDARVTSTVDATRDKMKSLGKTYDPHVFDGAGHGFLRAQSGHDGANRRAAEQAWPLTVQFLRGHGH